MTTPAAPEIVTPAAGEAAAAAALASVPVETPATVEATPVVAEPVAPAAPVAPVVPTTYDLKLPDGVTDTALVERTAATARALGLSNEAAQKLLERDATAANESASTRFDGLVKDWSVGGTEFVKRDTAWRAEALADPMLGAGDAAKLALAEQKGAEALGKFAPELLPLLKETGYASHPAIIKAFARIGNAMSESKLVLGAPVPDGKPKLAMGLYENDGRGPIAPAVVPT